MTRIALLNQRRIFNSDVLARNTFRDYQQGMNNDQDPLDIPLMTHPSTHHRTQRSRHETSHPHEDSPPNNPGCRRDCNGQVITQHKNQQFDYQPLTNNQQTDIHMTRATSAPPSNPPPYAQHAFRDNPEYINDVQDCYCASVPGQFRPCMRDMSNVQL